MDGVSAIRKMMKSAGLSSIELSRRIGKSRAYISSTLAHGSTPKVDTMARIAHECGYRLVLKNDETGNEVELYSRQDAESHLKKSLGVDSLRFEAGTNLTGFLKALNEPNSAYSSTDVPEFRTVLPYHDSEGNVYPIEFGIDANAMREMFAPQDNNTNETVPVRKNQIPIRAYGIRNGSELEPLPKDFFKDNDGQEGDNGESDPSPDCTSNSK